jgi:hypothetical protein
MSEHSRDVLERVDREKATYLEELRHLFYVFLQPFTGKGLIINYQTVEFHSVLVLD